MSDLTQQDRDELKAMIEVGWVQACLERDWGAAAALCTEDVKYMAADLPLMQGRPAVEAFLNDFPNLIEFGQELVSAEGDESLAVLRMTFGGTFEVDGQQLSAVGKGLGTASKLGGAWQFSAVCWNWDAPPAPSE